MRQWTFDLRTILALSQRPGLATTPHALGSHHTFEPVHRLSAGFAEPPLANAGLFTGPTLEKETDSSERALLSLIVCMCVRSLVSYSESLSSSWLAGHRETCVVADGR